MCWIKFVFTLYLIWAKLCKSTVKFQPACWGRKMKVMHTKTISSGLCVAQELRTMVYRATKCTTTNYLTVISLKQKLEHQEHLPARQQPRTEVLALQICQLQNVPSQQSLLCWQLNPISANPGAMANWQSVSIKPGEIPLDKGFLFEVSTFIS